MGTTITAALVADAAVSFGHVGDSRAYLWRDGVLQQLSDDHSLVGELVRRGALTPEEAERHPQKNIITRTVGTETALDVDTWTLEAAPDDVFLLASDGLNNMIRDTEIAAILTAAPSLAHAARELVRAANAAGGVDNITALLFRVGTGAPVTVRRMPARDTTLLPEMIFVDEPQPKRRRGLPPAAVRAVGGRRQRRARGGRARGAAAGALRRRHRPTAGSRSTRACRSTWSATCACTGGSARRRSPSPC